MTLDPWQDAAAFLRFAIDPDPAALATVLARYDDAEDLRRLLNAISIILSATVITPDGEIKALLQERLDPMAVMFMSPDSDDEGA